MHPRDRVIFRRLVTRVLRLHWHKCPTEAQKYQNTSYRWLNIRVYSFVRPHMHCCGWNWSGNWVEAADDELLSRCAQLITYTDKRARRWSDMSGDEVTDACVHTHHVITSGAAPSDVDLSRTLWARITMYIAARIWVVSSCGLQGYKW